MAETNFENYLKIIHDKEEHHLDDEAPELFDNWLESLTIDEVMDYAQDCINKIIKK